jgi:uncharacterized protein involved in exopolysaccharide biosynthesis
MPPDKPGVSAPNNDPDPAAQDRPPAPAQPPVYPPCYYHEWFSPEAKSNPDGWFERTGMPRVTRRWYWIPIAMLIGALAGMAIARQIPPTYEARAQIVPLKGREILGINPQIFGIDIIQDILRANLPTSFDTLSGIKIRSYLESYWLTRLIVEENNLAHGLLDLPADAPLTREDHELAITRLQRQLVLDLPRLSDILNIRFRGPDPEQGAALIQSYLDRLDQFLREQTIERSQSNADYLQKVRDTLREKELIQRLNSLIMTQYEQIAYARASGNVFFEVLEPPHPRYRPVAPNPTAYAVVGAMLVALLSLFPVMLIPTRTKIL